MPTTTVLIEEISKNRKNNKKATAFAAAFRHYHTHKYASKLLPLC